jgi:hypothetical protein
MLEERTALKLMASLGAAIWLLENGGRKAAASDKIFEQSIKDYKGHLAQAKKELRDA